MHGAEIAPCAPLAVSAVSRLPAYRPKAAQRTQGAKRALVVRLLRWAVMSAVFVPLVVRQVQKVNNVQFFSPAEVQLLEAMYAQFADLEPRLYL